MRMPTRARLRRLLGLLQVFREQKVLFPYPERVDVPPGSRIVVLAPHPDDDVLGCGGTLAKHVAMGASVSVIYLTDGRKGDPTFASEDELVLERQREALAAAAVLGIRQIDFLGARDQELRASAETVASLRNALLRRVPDLVYVPFFLDNHVDHFETNRVFIHAVREYTGALMVAAYETWTPLIPNVVVDITDTIGLKERALECHRTQLKVIDQRSAFRGLNAYRAAFAHVKGFAESFMLMPLRQYAQALDRFAEHDPR